MKEFMTQEEVAREFLNFLHGDEYAYNTYSNGIKALYEREKRWGMKNGYKVRAYDEANGSLDKYILIMSRRDTMIDLMIPIKYSKFSTSIQSSNAFDIYHSFVKVFNKKHEVEITNQFKICGKLFIRYLREHRRMKDIDKWCRGGREGIVMEINDWVDSRIPLFDTIRDSLTTQLCKIINFGMWVDIRDGFNEYYENMLKEG